MVGDFDSKEMMAEVKRLTADWKKAEVPKLDAPAPKLADKGTEKIITMPQAVQVQLYLGHLGIKRDDPDYYKLLVMDYVFGTGPGFTDRLSSRLRDREGLGYTVTGNITTSASNQPGLFACYIGTDPQKFARAKKLFLEEINRIRDEKVSDTELEDAKTYLTGSKLLSFATNAGIATQLLSIERYDLGFTYLKDFQKAVNAVTADDVQAAAKKHIDPKRMVLVAAGAIDGEGKAIQKAPPPKP